MGHLSARCSTVGLRAWIKALSGCCGLPRGWNWGVGWSECRVERRGGGVQVQVQVRMLIPFVALFDSGLLSTWSFVARLVMLSVLHPVDA